MRVQIFNKGKSCYSSPSVMDIRDLVISESNKLWPEVLRFENPHTYYVDLSEELWILKQGLLHKYSNMYK
jgi:nicotinate phosphoribosyltransferase